MAEQPQTSAQLERRAARVLANAWQLWGELTTSLQREGVQRAEYEQWSLALDEGGGGSTSTASASRQLERELARNERALAETTTGPVYVASQIDVNRRSPSALSAI